MGGVERLADGGVCVEAGCVLWRTAALLMDSWRRVDLWESNNLFTGVAYQISGISDIYVTIHS